MELYIFDMKISESKAVINARNNIKRILTVNSKKKNYVYIKPWKRFNSLKDFIFTPCIFMKFANRIITLEIDGFAGTISRYDLSLYRGISKAGHSLKRVQYKKTEALYKSEISQSRDTINIKQMAEIASCVYPAVMRVENLIDYQHGFSKPAMVKISMRMNLGAIANYISLLKSKKKLKYVFLNDFNFSVLLDEFFFLYLARLSYKIAEVENFKLRVKLANAQHKYTDELKYLSNIN